MSALLKEFESSTTRRSSHPFASTEMNVTQLPFNALIGIERSEADGALLQLPAGSRYLNHLGTVHASALLAFPIRRTGQMISA